MNGTIEQTFSGGAAVAERTGTTVRVGTAAGFVGEVLLDEAERVRQHARNIPRDVVLKVLVQYTRRNETCGKLTGRDGRAYFWHVAGEGDDC
jgi:hypothetical protein